MNSISSDSAINQGRVHGWAEVFAVSDMSSESGNGSPSVACWEDGCSPCSLDVHVGSDSGDMERVFPVSSGAVDSFGSSGDSSFGTSRFPVSHPDEQAVVSGVVMSHEVFPEGVVDQYFNSELLRAIVAVTGESPSEDVGTYPVHDQSSVVGGVGSEERDDGGDKQREGDREGEDEDSCFIEQRPHNVVYNQDPEFPVHRSSDAGVGLMGADDLFVWTGQQSAEDQMTFPDFSPSDMLPLPATYEDLPLAANVDLTRFFDGSHGYEVSQNILQGPQEDSFLSHLSEAAGESSCLQMRTDDGGSSLSDVDEIQDLDFDKEH